MPELCKVDGCAFPVNARGWCSTHYGRWRKNGTPEPKCAGCGIATKDGRTKFCGPECKPRCTFDGCNKLAYARNGLCAGHDRQLRETGELRPFKFERPGMGGKCAVCEASIPSDKRWMYCSDACKQRASHHRRRGGAPRPTAFTCQGCGVEVSLTSRRPDGKLRRSDAKWCNECLTDDNRRRFYRYGVTPERYAQAAVAGCEVCGKTDVQLHVDHDHTCCAGGYTCGECVRGFLCGPCNRAVGLLDENADRMLAAAAYVLRFSDVLVTQGGARSRS